MTKEGASFIDARRVQAVREREETEKEITSKVAANQKGWFVTLMKAAQKASVLDTHGFPHLYFQEGGKERILAVCILSNTTEA